MMEFFGQLLDLVEQDGFASPSKTKQNLRFISSTLENALQCNPGGVDDMIATRKRGRLTASAWRERISYRVHVGLYQIYPGITIDAYTWTNIIIIQTIGQYDSYLII